MSVIKQYIPTEHKVKALVFGPSGVGKTFFGGTCPKPIFASAEGGLLSIAHLKPYYSEIKSVKDLAELLVFLKKGDHNFETVIIDSITEINEIIKAEIETRTGREIEKQMWAEVSRKIKQIFRGFRDLPMHVLFIAHEKITMDGDIVRNVMPNLNGKSATEIAYYMDIVGYYHIDKGGERLMEIEENEKLPSKCRGGFIDNRTEQNFSEWINRLNSFNNFEQDKDDIIITESKHKVEKTVKMTAKQVSDSNKLWGDIWDLFIEYKELGLGYKESDFSLENKEPMRAAILKQKFDVNTTLKMTEEMGNLFINDLKNKKSNLKSAIANKMKNEK